LLEWWDNVSILAQHLFPKMHAVTHVTMCDHISVIIVVTIEEDETVKIKYSKPLLRMHLTLAKSVLTLLTEIFAVELFQLSFVSFQEPTVILGYLPGLNRRQL